MLKTVVLLTIIFYGNHFHFVSEFFDECNVQKNNIYLKLKSFFNIIKVFMVFFNNLLSILV